MSELPAQPSTVPTKTQRPPPVSVKPPANAGEPFSIDWQATTPDQCQATAGTPNPEIAAYNLAGVAEIMRLPGDDMEAMGRRVNMAASRLHALEAENAMEGMVGTLLAGVQDAVLFALKDCNRADLYDSRRSSSARAERLISSFVRLADLRARLRGGGTTQRMTVEHVTVTAGGQAVIGTVTGGGAGGDKGRNGDQPHAQA